jgi:hypothetical protein
MRNFSTASVFRCLPFPLLLLEEVIPASQTSSKSCEKKVWTETQQVQPQKGSCWHCSSCPKNNHSSKSSTFEVFSPHVPAQSQILYSFPHSMSWSISKVNLEWTLPIECHLSSAKTAKQMIGCHKVYLTPSNKSCYWFCVMCEKLVIPIPEWLCFGAHYLGLLLLVYLDSHPFPRLSDWHDIPEDDRFLKLVNNLWF